ncbi:similar to Saccharomyces cerevisiae YDL108W KIN28 Serine/threonine protein kinase, subunit of the transcription factor TFIIH [Maudiozyma saulgeensis]|uniref:[RNA-polymerase]-subunit kinase n=1 Tax=Maudiozyma saulgeensis TaxID=1789683 RepID=A0A1X7QZH3_9SACH|nr:similar to Saccharomyces cerevisiae YDL108W KIN28 Serine/threonine protein kinase, subunit of the transcription factor TFIIH [Kazachstania saulgeensis]
MSESNYTKEKKVGEGTYAVVYLGKQLSSGDSIAVKEIKTSEFKDGLDMSAIREVKYLQELNHPNVINLIDIFMAYDNLNLVLEFLPTDLEVVIKDKNILFTPADIKSWMLMTLRGVYHVHRNFILHRDLKPNNLLISPDGLIKVADFGLARAVPGPREMLTSNVVTRWYRAPELLFGAKHYTYAVDVWSIGVIFAELMLRIPYLPGQDDMNQMEVTFRALGTPTDKQWPEVSSFPGYNKLQIYPSPSRDELRKRFIAATESALTLMENMLMMNPQTRWNTIQCLESEYFKELPAPSDPADINIFSQKV